MTQGYDWKKLLDEANEAGGFEALPPSTYDVKCISAKVQRTKAGDKDMIVTQFKVFGGPADGRMVWHNFTLTPDSPNAMRFFFQHMTALGLGPEFFANGPAIEQVAGALTGRDAKIETEQEMYEGQTRTRVKKFMRASGVIPQAGMTQPAPAAQPQPQQEVAPSPQPAPQPTTPSPSPQPQQSAPSPEPQPQSSTPPTSVDGMTPEQQQALLQQLLAQQAQASSAPPEQAPAPTQTGSVDEPPKPPF